MPRFPTLGRRSGRGERGATLVEAALLLPLLLAVLLGIATGGIAYFRHISVVEAVREGARYATTLQLGAGASPLTTWEEAVRSRVVEASGGTLAPTDICVTLVLPTGGTACGVADPPGAGSEPSIHLVKISASRPTTLQFFFFDTTRTLRSELAARWERDSG